VGVVGAVKLTVLARVVVEDSGLAGREVRVEPVKILRDPHQQQITQVIESFGDDLYEEGGEIVSFDIDTDEAIG